MSGLIAPAINFTILVSILVYFLRAPLKEFVRGRQTTLSADLKSVHEQLRQAQAQYEEFSAKLAAIHVEISAMRDEARRDAQAMRAKVEAEAKKLAATIVQDAQSSSQALVGDLRSQLRSELGVRVLKRAEQLIRERLTAEDRTRIRHEFSKQLESAS